MSEPFIAQVTMFAGNFSPRNWSFCNGQILSISQNSTLFSLLGTTYGGDGRVTFGLPDLRGRVPMHWGSGPGLTPRVIGEKGGSEAEQLSVSHMPAHSHFQRGAEEDADSADPGGNVCATTSGNVYHGTADANMGATTNVGNSQAHDNIQPFQCVSFIIALAGMYPSRS